MADKDRENIVQNIYEAYVYAYSAVMEELTKRVFLNPEKDGKKVFKTNTYYHHAALADASFQQVVAPNIDTVYSQAWIDLSEGALILEKPELDRYVTITFLDAYTNCENYVGTGADGQQAETYLITGPDFVGEVPEEYRRIELPTNNVWSAVRTIIYGKDDLEAVKEIQNKIQLKPYGNAKQEVLYPSYQPELDFKPIIKIEELSLEEYFGIFNQLLEKNKDKYAPTEKLEQWKTYGIGEGLDFTKEKSIRALEKEVKEKFRQATKPETRKSSKNNGWVYPDFGIGVYKTDYLLRANVARNGLGGNPASMSVYPGTYRDSDGNPLDGRKRYLLHFEKGQLPPVNEYGFWSITLYDNRERYLTDNEIDRYGFNDRDVLKENEDGSIDIYIQQERPEKEKESNWLPSPKEPFNLILRIYLAKEEVISEKWKPPVISEIVE
jgi:hypothetical protein